MALDYDVVVIGSGFGGSVSALRLTEKGYRVAVVEAGRRFRDAELPATSWRLRRYVFAPALRCFGILRLTLLDDVLVMSGAGVGGGSLGYANTLYEPPEAFYRDPQWADITDWRAELAPAFDQAKRMLGVTLNPIETAADRALREVAADLGVAKTFSRTPVGVLFSGLAPGSAHDSVRDTVHDSVRDTARDSFSDTDRDSFFAAGSDPFFGGVGPARQTCTFCGSCMTGCRVGAKNTLVKNYLYLAERGGATVLPMSTVTDVRPRDGGGFTVRVWRTGGVTRRDISAEQVIFAAGALGTQRLLHRLRENSLPAVSPRLGELSRTNSESILGARTRRRGTDFSRGVAITSSFHPDPVTHVEPVRYGRGSNLLALLATVLVDDTGGRSRLRTGVREILRQWRDLRLLAWPRRWSEQTVVLLGMQALDNSITVRRVRGRLRTRQGEGSPNPVWVPAAHDVARRLAAKIDGVPLGAVTELVGRPVTGHFLGGCAIGAVIDPYHRLYGYPGLHVIDGSAVPANLGVNPALTITALAERALAIWPNKGDPDPRPEPGLPYRNVAFVPPRHPIVPTSAPGALRWENVDRA